MWIILAIIQAICFLLSNGRFHPLAKLLEGCDVSSEGKFAMPRQVKAIYHSKIATNKVEKI